MKRRWKKIIAVMLVIIMVLVMVFYTAVIPVTPSCQSHTVTG